MEFARPIMWNVPHWAEITLYLLIPVVLLAFVAGVVWRVRKWFLGQEEPGTATVREQLLGALQPRRLLELTKSALFQSRLSRDVFALLMHQTIFWGMVVLALGTALATDRPGFRLSAVRRPDPPRELLSAVRVGAGRVWDRADRGRRPGRLSALRAAARALRTTRARVSLWDAFPLLTCILLIAVTGFLVEGLRIAEGFHIEDQVAAAGGAEAKAQAMNAMGLRERFHMGPERQDVQLGRIAAGQAVFPAAVWAPVGYGMAKTLAAVPEDGIRLLHQAAWWLHAALAFGLIVRVPFTKAFHLISSPANMLFRVPGPVGRLPVVDGVGRPHRARLHLAPVAAGRRLHLVRQMPGGLPRLQHGLSAFAARLRAGRRLPVAPHDGPCQRRHAEPSRVDDSRPRSCGPVAPAGPAKRSVPCQVQHPRLIIDMRRHLVDQGQVDEGLQDALMNFQRYGNSFGQSPRKRAEWTKALRLQAQGCPQGGSRVPVVRRRLRLLRSARSAGHPHDRPSFPARRSGHRPAFREGAERGERRAADRRGGTVLVAAGEERQGAGQREVPQAADDRSAYLQHVEERIRDSSADRAGKRVAGRARRSCITRPFWTTCSGRGG